MRNVTAMAALGQFIIIAILAAVILVVAVISVVESVFGARAWIFWGIVFIGSVASGRRYIRQKRIRLNSLNDKIGKLIGAHSRALAVRRMQTLHQDIYGNEIIAAWNKEKEYFLIGPFYLR